jgi:DinB superfamily
MDTKSFVVATNGRLKWYVNHLLNDLSDSQIHYSTPLIDDRPIMEVAMHATIVLFGTATVASGGQWSLDDYPLDGWPPKITQPASAAELVETLHKMLTQVDELVASLPDGALDKEVTLPWGQQVAGDAFSSGLTHALVHMGGIGGIRALGGFPTPAGY